VNLLVAALVERLATPGAGAEAAYQELLEAVTRDPGAAVPALLDALDDLRPVAQDFPFAFWTWQAAGRAPHEPAPAREPRPRPLTIADLAAVLVWNETREDFGFRSDLAAEERARALERLRRLWERRRPL
jgi:hypothetical protein